MALRIANVIKSKKGKKLIVLDMRPVADFCDYFVIVSATSLKQANAVALGIKEDLDKDKIKSLSKISGVDESGWVALDFSSVIVHIFYEPIREFYALESLWSDAKRVRIPRKIV
ncbi:MAG: ribosome silencing factor [Candidatus Omnitrophota bacterium]